MTSLPITGTTRFSVYTGRVTNWPAVAVELALLVPLIALAVESDDSWDAGTLALLASFVGVGVLLAVLTGTSVRATAGPNGVTVRWGVLGWPRLGYPLAEIEQAEVIDLRLWWVSFGLWWTPTRTCCTVRSGPTLRLRLRNGRTVTVSVPEPAAAVAALDAARTG